MDVNVVAVIVAAVVGHLLGFLWYSPMMFGNMWMKLNKVSKKEIDNAKEKGMAKPMIISFIGLFVMGFVMSWFLGAVGASTVLMGTKIGFWLWLGFIAPVLIASVLWDNKPWKLYVLNVSHYLVVLIVMGGILAAWV